MGEHARASRWWILVAGVFGWGIVSSLLLVAVVFFDIGGLALVYLAYGAIALLILLPVGLYFDGKHVTAVDMGWRPDVTLYVVAGLFGVALPLLSVITAGVYLYRRHRAIGIP